MHGRPSDTGWQPPRAESPPDPKALRAKRIRNGLIVLGVIAAVAFAAGWNPPTKNVHKFTKASDYKSERESGCTNSGKGCHGSEKSYSDFNAYHPDSKCTACHEYQGVGCIPCHMPKETECQLCHDGSMKQAPDVVRLTDPYPRGHYRETTHTAMGTPMDANTRVAEDGKASAKCSDCHSRDLRKSHTEVPAVADSPYGTSIGCGECHNDVRANGLAEVLDKWKKRACADCHKTGSSSPQHGTDTASKIEGKSALDCGATGAGCHDVNDLHALHKDKPKRCSGPAEKGEPTCHVVGAEAGKPTAITCGGPGDDACHRLYENGDYTHKHDAEKHSVQGGVLAGDTSFWDTPCGGCHMMKDDGTGLSEEHALSTSLRSEETTNTCTNCHNHAASVSVVLDSWPTRDGGADCSVCHGVEGLPAAHLGNLTAKHEASSEGCSDSGPGCHPVSDLMQVGEPTTEANIHRDCLRCHDWAESDGNTAYDPAKKTCGEGGDCHGAAGAYDPATDIHNGTSGRTDGKDRAHTAGKTQAEAVLVDAVSGVKSRCSACHDMRLGAEHGRPNAARDEAADTKCVACHNADVTTASIVKSSWGDKAGDAACAACHVSGASREPLHRSLEASHTGTELGVDGSLDSGACVGSGCHAARDLRVLHNKTGCTAKGCHTDSGDIFGSRIRSCGGSDPRTACHTGFSENAHYDNHAADRSGVVHGVAYQAGTNGGCFGCHVADLRIEHENARKAGELEGGGASSCAVCHATAEGAGRFASLPAVKQAIANHDVRCVACHASGSKLDGPDAVASAHKQLSGADVLAPGTVWADPLGDWKAAFDSATGSGHNTLSSEAVGGRVDKRFPQTRFSIEGTTYVWALPPNTGATAWLDTTNMPVGDSASTSAIQRVTVSCDDCHILPDDMKGPHGASVPIAIDPDYSQTEYANPTRDESQFEATGTDRVICFKCHPVFSGGIQGSDAPGGAALHARHVSHPDLPISSGHHNGEACVDCHVRIPHAWKRPRLLIRSVQTTDGVVPDAFPYVLRDHDGLVGIRLRSFDPQTQLRSGSCVTGGCHPKSSATRHPRPSQIPGAKYWP